MSRITSPILRRIVSRFALTALFGASVALAGCGRKEDDKKVMIPALPVMRVEAGDADIPTPYSVRLEGRSDAEIRPQVDGVLQEILVKEGDLVKKGQPLFRIDDSTYRELYNTAVAARQAAEAQASVARVNAEKLVPLVENKVVAPVQLTTAKAQEQAAKAAAAQAAAQARAARINLDYSVVKAPFAGYVGRIPFRQGTLVTKNQAQPLTTLADVSRMYAVFSISELEFARFKGIYPGNTINEKLASVPPVTLTLSDGSVYPHPGKLESLSGGFDRVTGSIGMRASFPNEAGLLRSGNSGTVSLSARFNGIMLVPQTATVDLQDKIFVFLLQPGSKVKKQVVSVSGKSGPNYIVTAGIRPGDTIVTAGIDKLKDGAVVKPAAAVPAAGPAPAATPVNAR
ncbi:MAG: efflux RND transporter periplasmic adaptor subunit [Chlorobiaceae bacterium]|nr:efflux RND transporter periplasmic adaptor subunit [Chlorobiaceae bacterium]